MFRRSREVPTDEPLDTEPEPEPEGASDSGAVFRREERLSFSEALWMYTRGAAYAARCEHLMGDIAPGYAADLVVVDAAVLETPSLLARALPRLVVVGGQIEHTDGSLALPPALLAKQYQGGMEVAPPPPPLLGDSPHGGSGGEAGEARSAAFVPMGGPFVPGE